MHFNIGDSVLLLGKYAQPYASRRGKVRAVRPNALRQMFDEYLIELSTGGNATVFAFQVVDDASLWPTLHASIVRDQVQPMTRHHGSELLSRQILLDAADFVIELESVVRDQRRPLFGCIRQKSASRLPSDLEIRLIENGLPVQTLPTTDLGEFQVSHVPTESIVIEILVRKSRQRILATA